MQWKQNMKLKTKLLILMFGIFLLASYVLCCLAKAFSNKMNEEWNSRYIQKQIEFDKYRTLTPILKEMELVSKMAKEPILKEMAKDETNPKIYQEGIALLEQYKNIFKDRSYFVAFKKSGHYYYNDKNGTFNNKQFQYTLAETNPNDSWFYTSIKVGEDIIVNVDRDAVLGITKVWLNCLLRDGDKVIGVIGTGFDFDSFIEESVALKTNGGKNYFIDKQMAIQLAKEKDMIDYASYTKKNGEHKTIDSLFDNKEDVTAIQKAMEELSKSTNKDVVKSVWVTKDNLKQLVGIAYLPEVEWYNLTIIEEKELVFFRYEYIFILLVFLLLIALILVNQVINQMFIKPINELKQQMQQIQNGHNDGELVLIGTAEIAELSQQFNTMIEHIRNNDRIMEEKIEERTAYLRYSEEKFRALFDSTHDAVMLLDENGFFECNQATLDIFESPNFETFYALHPSDLSPAHQPNGDNSLIEAVKHINKAFKNGREHFEWVHTKYKSKENFYAEVTLNAVVLDGKNVLQAMVRDINQKKLKEEEMHKLAFYDPLTHLPNRRLLNERVQHTMQLSKRSDDRFALMFLDLDNFKPLNDKFGHDIGDLLLIEVANRLRNCVRESDTVARFGGDEFVILLEKIGENEDVAINHVSNIAQKVLQSIEEEYILNNQIKTVTHHCSVSIGIEIFSNDIISKDDMFKHADEAMYRAKELGKGRVVFYKDL